MFACAMRGKPGLQGMAVSHDDSLRASIEPTTCRAGQVVPQRWALGSCYGRPLLCEVIERHRLPLALALPQDLLCLALLQGARAAGPRWKQARRLRSQEQ